MSLANLRRFWAMAARWNSSRVDPDPEIRPEGPRVPVIEEWYGEAARRWIEAPDAPCPVKRLGEGRFEAQTQIAVALVHSVAEAHHLRFVHEHTADRVWRVERILDDGGISNICIDHRGSMPRNVARSPDAKPNCPKRCKRIPCYLIRRWFLIAFLDKPCFCDQLAQLSLRRNPYPRTTVSRHLAMS
jgi:hypothetical protein